MSKSVTEQFKDNIPEVLKNNDLIDKYAEAVGEVFEEIRQDINYKAFETDYAKSRFLTFDKVTSNIGLQLSPFLKEEVTRRIVRDAPSVYARMGTRGSLEWALKNLGYRSYEIDEAWVPNPDLVRVGYFRDLYSTEEPYRYNLRPRSYTDFVVGEEYVTPQGTFFRGYVYDDFEKDNVIEAVPIYGETYSTYTGLTFKDMVSKTPYVIVRLYDAPLYDEVISDVDPSTGEPINLTIQEKQKVITDSIRYLIQNLQRTATTTIILVTDLLIFDEMMGRMLDQLTFETTQTGIDTVDQIASMESEYTEDMYLMNDTDTVTKIGSKRPIGVESTFPATGDYVDGGVIGYPEAFVNRDVIDSSLVRGQGYDSKVVNPTVGYEHVHFLDFEATVNFTAPSGVSIDVYQVRNYHFSPVGDRVLVQSVSGGQTFNQTIPDSHALIFVFNDAYDGSITITSTYS